MTASSDDWLFFQFVVQSSWFSPRFVCACRQKVRCQFHQHLFNGQKRGGVFPFSFAGLRNNKTTAQWRFSTHHPESANKMRQLAALVRFPDTTTEANIIKEFNQTHIKLTAACFQRRIQHLHSQFIYKPLENNKVSKGTKLVPTVFGCGTVGTWYTVSSQQEKHGAALSCTGHTRHQPLAFMEGLVGRGPISSAWNEVSDWKWKSPSRAHSSWHS